MGIWCTCDTADACESGPGEAGTYVWMPAEIFTLTASTSWNRQGSGLVQIESLKTNTSPKLTVPIELCSVGSQCF